MRGGDLLHHMKPQNVRGLLVLRRALQCRQNGRRIACAVVRDGQAEAISGNIRLHLDLYGCRIMPDAVAQQVFQQSFQQGAVHAEFRLLCGSGLLQRHLAGLRLRTFAELRHQLPEQRPRRKFLLAQGLCPIFQLAGQVQILDQGAEFFALGADAAGLLPGSFRQDGVPLQLLRPAQDQRQRGAHIVADPGDPLGAGIVGALVGLFSAFMPPLASYFVPFGYYIPLSAYEVANWDKATHTVTYGTRPFNWGLLAFTLALGAVLFALAWRKVQDEEV